MTRLETIDPIIKELDAKFKLNTREYSLIRTAALDVCIAFESRTCANCRYCDKEYVDRLNVGSCELAIGTGYCVSNEVDLNFGCNRFERNTYD